MSNVRNTVHVEFDTREYTRSHGKEPRGIGMWAFALDGKLMWASGSYGGAKRIIVKRVQSMAVSSVVVSVQP